MPIESALREAVKAGFAQALSLEIQDLVLRETRRAFREHEAQISAFVRAAITNAFAEMLQ